MFWTPRQRLALSVLILLILTYLFILHLWHPSRISTPQPQQAPRASELLDQLDPNHASASDLAALPNIGPAMARRILEDREQFQKQNPSQLPYRQLKDLERIKGIGPATLENLKPYLTFPPQSRTPDTAPS
jgi:competence protein ComEA